MGLKETWIDKVNGEDIIDADDVNNIAHAVMDLEDGGSGGTGGGDSGDYMPNIPSMDNGNTIANGGIVGYNRDVPIKFTWEKFKTFLESNLEVRVPVLTDPDTEYTASIPPLEEDTMLLTEQDIPLIVERVVEALPAAEGASF